MNYLNLSKFIAKQQHGFVRNKGCVTTLLKILNELQQSSSKTEDLCSFFKFCQSIRQNRQQRIVLGEIILNWADVTSDVPKGSVLGPLLFIIYINDHPNILNYYSCKLHADDSKLIAKISNEEDPQKIQIEIKAIVIWKETWLMKLNVDKCKVMDFGYGNT
ncbi:uncharacterized protein LOC136082997 [Hydra vulgaris]|uniref:Uncharacterized protein LOC136082997 n=1 Tax=Hydra vulgaris TaxID=6087 RepID=A0ABM4CA05_HYDVU